MPRKRKWKIAIYFTIGISIILLIAYPLLNKIAENNVKEKLKQLAPFAIVRYSSIRANLFSSRISIHDLSITFQPDTSDLRHHHLFNFSQADFTGVRFIDAILNKHLSINKLTLNKGTIDLDQFLLNKKDPLQYDLSSRMPFKKISINHLETSETNVWTHINQENKMLLQGSMNLYNLEIDPHQPSGRKTLPFKSIQCNVSTLDYHIPSSNQIIQIKHLSLDSRKEAMTIDSLKFISAETDTQSTHIETFISNIAISKFDVLKLADKKLIAGTIIVDKSNTHISSPKTIKKNPESIQLPASDLKQIFSEIKIDFLAITHSACRIGNFNQFKVKKIEIAGLNKSFDSSLSWSSFKCSISDIKYSIPDAYRTLQINNLEADSKKMLLKIADAKITTQYPKFEYGKKLGRQADYIEATVPLIKISEMNFKQLPEKRLVADKIMINESNVYLFRDRRLPRQLKEQPMPNGYLKEIPLTIRVNTFQINNTSVIYEEFPKIGNKPGHLAIYKMNISMSPLLNHPAKNDPGYSNTYVEGSIMNAGLIKATIRAPLRKNIYFIKGNIKDLDLPKLNPSAENLGRFHIESGILNSLEFHFTATEENAKGEIVGEYHNLIIDRLKVKKGEKRVAKVPSFLLKHLIIPKNKDKSLNVKKRTGKIEYDRDPTRLVTYYFLKSLVDGIRASFTLGFLLPK